MALLKLCQPTWRPLAIQEKQVRFPMIMFLAYWVRQKTQSHESVLSLMHSIFHSTHLHTIPDTCIIQETQALHATWEDCCHMRQKVLPAITESIKEYGLSDSLKGLLSPQAARTSISEVCCHHELTSMPTPETNRWLKANIRAQSTKLVSWGTTIT